jgi:hypothetical protein
MSVNSEEGSEENFDAVNQDLDPFAPVPQTPTLTVIQSYELTSLVSQGSENISINATAAEIKNGSVLLIGPETFTVLDDNADGSFRVDPAINSFYPIGTPVYLVSEPKTNYVVDNTPCKVIFDYDNLYNLSVGVHKTYTFTFNSEESFNQFEFINYGDHSVTSSYPTITLKTSAIGPKNFQYKTHSNYGNVSIDSSCDPCSNLNFEIFTSSDDILYFDDTLKYLTNCGSSQFSKEILDVRVLDCECGHNTFLVTYCCDTSKDVSTDYCVATWNTICKDDVSGIIEISAPSLSCEAFNITFDKWIYSSSLNSLVYRRKIHFCFHGCTSFDVDPRFLIDPPQPTDKEWTSCPCLAPTPTETATTTTSPSPTYMDNSNNSSALNSIQNVHLAGDKPYFNDASCLAGHSKVLTKFNTSDLPDRVFYKSSVSGYFFEEYGEVRSAYPTGTRSSDSATVNNSNFYLREETSSEKSSTFKGLSSTNPSIALFTEGTDIEYDNFISIVDYENPPPTPTTSVDVNLVKDQSLFYKTFTIPTFGFTNSDLINFTVAQLNWKYWFSDLPKSIYGKNEWWVGLSQSEMPSFEIIQDTNDLSTTQYNFEFERSKVFPDIVAGKFLYDNFSLIKVKNLPSDFDFNRPSNKHFQGGYFTDPVFNTSVLVGSVFLKIVVEYSFNPKSSSIVSEYSSLSYPIKRKEEMTIFLDPFKGTYNSNQALFSDPKDSFPYNFAKDKTLGITNPVYNLVQGRGKRYS